MSLLGTIPDVSDHYGETHGTLTRCALDGQLWPCSAVDEAKRLLEAPVDLLELIDVGWFLAERYPEQLDEPPRRIKGIVGGYRDDDERGRIYTLVSAVAGRPRMRELAARDVDPHMGDDALPNAKYIRSAYRCLAAHVGGHTGTGDGTDVKYLAMALALAQVAT